MKEVYPGIFLIKEKGAFGPIRPTENIFILAGHDGLIYDAGYGKKKDIKAFLAEFEKIKHLFNEQKKPFNVIRILPSHAHPDHFSGLKSLRKHLGVKILLTNRTAELIKSKKIFIKHYEPNYKEDYLISKFSIKDRLQAWLYRLIYPRIYGLTFIRNPDIIIDEKTDISINDEKWSIFPSPGHASDHLSLYNEEKGILFSGDNIIKKINTWLGPPLSNVEDYIKSIEFIQNLPKLEIIFSAHGSPIKKPKKRITEILHHREERTQQVLDLVKESFKEGISPSGIIHSLYPNATNMMNKVARGWICLTLKMLEEKNFIKREIGKKHILFFPA